MVKAVYVLMKRRMPLICVKNDRKLKEKKKKSVEKNFEKKKVQPVCKKWAALTIYII